jgi:gamma-glutamyltranspeptidase/glutathione hydrolase
MESVPEYASFFDEKGEVIPLGSNFKRPDYARTLAMIAENPTAFYEGEIAEGIVRAVQDQEGLMTLDDLKGKTHSDHAYARLSC